MKQCLECNRKFKDEEEFCSGCGTSLLPLRKRKAKKQEIEKTSTLVFYIVGVFALFIIFFALIQSLQSSMNPATQQIILQNAQQREVTVTIYIDNDDGLDWFLYIDDMSAGHWGNYEYRIITEQVTKDQYHTFELRDPGGVVLDSCEEYIDDEEDIFLTI